MIFVLLWVIFVYGIISFIFYNVVQNMNKTEKINISEENGRLDNSIEIVTTSVKEEEKETIYIIKEYKGNIAIYVLDENGKENLRETTSIITKYLPEIDRQKLEIGIRVTGKEELNKVLEDYE